MNEVGSSRRSGCTRQDPRGSTVTNTIAPTRCHLARSGQTIGRAPLRSTIQPPRPVARPSALLRLPRDRWSGGSRSSIDRGSPGDPAIGPKVPLRWSTRHRTPRRAASSEEAPVRDAVVSGHGDPVSARHQELSRTLQLHDFTTSTNYTTGTPTRVPPPSEAALVRRCCRVYSFDLAAQADGPDSSGDERRGSGRRRYLRCELRTRDTRMAACRR